MEMVYMERVLESIKFEVITVKVDRESKPVTYCFKLKQISLLSEYLHVLYKQPNCSILKLMNKLVKSIRCRMNSKSSI